MEHATLLSTGSEAFDQLLEGGYEKNVISTVYGPAGSGKTNIMLITVCDVVKKGGKVIYVDTEGSFSIARVLQILPDFAQYSKQITFFRPYNFDEQKHAFHKLKELIEQNPTEYQLIVIDSIAMLYRLEVGKTLDVSFVNRELGIQLGTLTEITRKYQIPTLITNQVYADFERKGAIKMVGGDLLKYTSKCLIELKKGHHGVRVATLIKHRNLPEGKEVAFKIVESGIEFAQIPTLASKVKDAEELM